MLSKTAANVVLEEPARPSTPIGVQKWLVHVDRVAVRIGRTVPEGAGARPGGQEEGYTARPSSYFSIYYVAIFYNGLDGPILMRPQRRERSKTSVWPVPAAHRRQLSLSGLKRATGELSNPCIVLSFYRLAWRRGGGGGWGVGVPVCVWVCGCVCGGDGGSPMGSPVLKLHVERVRAAV